ncbi:HEAT repeat domain-containing protein [bacterium]|nr:MAG: HEAT repeat domain-containing protein [bacterium]
MIEKKRYRIREVLASLLLLFIMVSVVYSEPSRLEDLQRSYYLALEEDRPAVLEDIRKLGSDEALQFTLGLLNYPDVKVRLEAVMSIKEWGLEGYKALFDGLENPEISWMCESIFVDLGSRSVPFLLDKLENERDYHRARAVYLLGIIGDPGAIGPLYNHLKDPSREVRIQTIQALTDMGDEEALGYILEVFETEDAALADFVLLAAERFGWRAANVLEASLQSRNERVRSGAAMALGRIGVPDSIPLLVRALGDSSPEVRRNIVRALGGFSGDKVIDALVMALGDPDPEVQEYASNALAGMGPGILPTLIGDLESPDPLVRKNVISTLRKIGDKRAVVPVIKMLEDPDEVVRLFAVSALMEFKDPRAIRPLIYRLGNEEKIHWMVAFAFMELGNEAVEELLVATGDEEFCYTRNLIILRMGDKALDVLHERARSGSGEVRMNAISLLGELGYRESLPVLSDLMEDEEVGWVAAYSLAGLGNDAWETLYRDTRSEGIRRKNALDSISRIEDPDTWMTLVDHLSDEDPDLRRVLSEPLVKAGTPVVPLLVEKMTTLDQEKFDNAAEILCRMNDPEAHIAITSILFPEPWTTVTLAGDRLFRFRQIYSQKGSIVAIRTRLKAEINSTSGGGTWQRVAP